MRERDMLCLRIISTNIENILSTKFKRSTHNTRIEEQLLKPWFYNNYTRAKKYNEYNFFYKKQTYPAIYSLDLSCR